MTPFTHPKISNLTIVGTSNGKVAESAMDDKVSMKSAANFRRNCKFTLVNSILYGYPTGILCETTNDHIFKNNVVNGVNSTFSGIAADASNTAAASVTAIGLTLPWGTAYRGAALQPKTTSSIATGASFTGLSGFTSVEYQGALAPAGQTNWLAEGTWVK